MQREPDLDSIFDRPRRFVTSFGGASAPTIPYRVHTMRGPKVGTGTSLGHASALMIARWWQFQHDTSSEHTPLARMLPSVIGSIASLKQGLFIRRRLTLSGELNFRPV
jgi:hypothetical protein